MNKFDNFVSEKLIIDLLLESKISYNGKFTTVLDNIFMKTNNEISRILLILQNTDVDVDTNNIDTSDKNDVVLFKSNSRMDRGLESKPSEIKIGRLVNRILDATKNNRPAKDIEEFVNLYKSEIDSLGDALQNFKLVKGDDILKYYNINNYVRGDGSLQNSCMSYEFCKHFFGIYTENPDKVGMLVYLDILGKVKGRALIWRLDSPNITFMDRIYTTNDYDVNLFIEYANKNDWYYKSSQNYSYKSFDIKGSKSFPSNKLSIKLNNFKFKYYPYLDTLAFLTENGILHNDNTIPSIGLLRDTDGADYYCSDCSGNGWIICDFCFGDGCTHCGDSGDFICKSCINVKNDRKEDRDRS